LLIKSPIISVFNPKCNICLQYIVKICKIIEHVKEAFKYFLSDEVTLWFESKQSYTLKSLITSGEERNLNQSLYANIKKGEYRHEKY